MLAFGTGGQEGLEFFQGHRGMIVIIANYQGNPSRPIGSTCRQHLDRAGDSPYTEMVRYPMTAPILSALLALILLAPARASESKDLSGQFPTAACRNQGQTGTCTGFTGVALLEAAVFRRHGAAGADGAKFQLSEADFVVRRAVASDDYFKLIGTWLQRPGMTLEWAVIYAESGNVVEDLKLAIAQGIATAKTVPWDTVQKRYDAYKKLQEAAISQKAQDCGIPDPLNPGAVNQALTQASESLAWVAETQTEIQADFAAGQGRSDTFEHFRVKPLQAAQRACVQMEAGALKVLSFSQWLEQSAGKKTSAAENYLLGDDPAISKDRARVQGLLKGFTVDSSGVGYVGGLAVRSDPAACRKAGQESRRQILARLRQGVPVAAGMDIGGLAVWYQTDPKAEAIHVFVLAGFELTGPQSDRLVLKTRNSWGGINPDIPEEHLCRITGLVAVLTDQEK